MAVIVTIFGTLLNFTVFVLFKVKTPEDFEELGASEERCVCGLLKR